jgi:hypothetical protein
VSDVTETQVDIKNRIDYLKGSRGLHAEVFQKLAKSDEGKIFGVDMVAWAVLNRSISLIDGFTMMIETGNILCAGALLRLQLDSAMRFCACGLVDDSQSLLMPLLKGEALKSVKSRTGESLTDAYLVAELSKIEPWVKSVYAATSGFIHLSKAHMISTVHSIEEASRNVSFGFGPREAKEEELIEFLDGFIAATKCLLGLVGAWLARKDEVALTREASTS